MRYIQARAVASHRPRCNLTAEFHGEDVTYRDMMFDFFYGACTALSIGGGVLCFFPSQVINLQAWWKRC